MKTGQSKLIKSGQNSPLLTNISNLFLKIHAFIGKRPFFRDEIGTIPSNRCMLNRGPRTSYYVCFVFRGWLHRELWGLGGG